MLNAAETSPKRFTLTVVKKQQLLDLEETDPEKNPSLPNLDNFYCRKKFFLYLPRKIQTS